MIGRSAGWSRPPMSRNVRGSSLPPADRIPLPRFSARLMPRRPTPSLAPHRPREAAPNGIERHHLRGTRREKRRSRSAPWRDPPARSSHRRFPSVHKMPLGLLLASELENADGFGKSLRLDPVDAAENELTIRPRLDGCAHENPGAVAFVQPLKAG